MLEVHVLVRVWRLKSSRPHQSTADKNLGDYKRYPYFLSGGGS